jgi:site-specific recombinase XerD
MSYMKDGRQHRESSGSTNKKIAEKLLTVRTAQVFEERWSLPRSKSPHLGPWVEEFLRCVSYDKTRSRYQSSINNVLKHFGKNIRLSEITPESVFRFQQARLEQGVGKATINRDTATLSSCLSRAKKMRLISHNPCSDVGKLNERRDRRQARPRAVWLTSHCRDALLRWRDLFGPEFSPFVFPSPRNPQVHFVDYKTAWRTAAKKAGLADRRIYDLRSTFASRANMCHATGLTVAHLLGHDSTQILPTYVRPLDENTRALIQALNALRKKQPVGPHSIN